MNQETFVLTLNVPFVQLLWAQPGVSDLKVLTLQNFFDTFWFQDLSQHNMNSILWYVEGKNSGIDIYSKGSNLLVRNQEVSLDCVTLHKISASKERLIDFFGITNDQLIHHYIVRRVCYELKRSPPYGMNVSTDDVNDIEKIRKRRLTSSLVKNGLSAERYRWIECSFLPGSVSEQETYWSLMQLRSPQHYIADSYDITVNDKLIIVEMVNGWQLMRDNDNLWFVPLGLDTQDLELSQIRIPQNVTVYEIDACFKTLLNLFFLNRPTRFQTPEMSLNPILNPNWFEVVKQWTPAPIDLDLTDW